jgi:hypothetical protein
MDYTIKSLQLWSSFLFCMGVIMIQGAKDCFECSKILHPPNFQKSLKKL